MKQLIEVQTKAAEDHTRWEEIEPQVIGVEEEEIDAVVQGIADFTQQRVRWVYMDWTQGHYVEPNPPQYKIYPCLGDYIEEDPLTARCQNCGNH